MNVTTRNEVLDSIDSMNEIVQESEFNVISSLLTQLDKASTILEFYNGSENELDMFAIYQEADEATGSTESSGSAVNSGEPSGQVNAELGKKKNIFSKIWQFIKNIFKSIGDFIKKCWNGKVVPAATTVSEKTEDVIEQVIGKDESWIKEHAAELGIAAVNIATFVALVKLVPEILKDSTSLALMVTGLINVAQGSLNATFAIKKGGVFTTLAIVAIPEILLGISELAFAIKGKKTADEVKGKINTAIEKLKGLFTKEEQQYSIEQVTETVVKVKAEAEKAADAIPDDYTDEEIEKMTPEEIKQDGDNAKKLGVLMRIRALINKIFTKVCDLLNFRKKIADNETVEGTENANEGGTDANANDAAVGTEENVENNDDVPTDEVQDTTETTETNNSNELVPGDGKKYTLDEVSNIMKDKFNFDIAVEDGKPTRGVVHRPESKNNGTIPAGKGNHRFKPTDDGMWVFEEADENINDNDEVVEESVSSGYYFKR